MAQTTIPRSTLEDAHRHCRGYRAEIERSELCGCFYCLGKFSRLRIEDWVDEPDSTQSAVCPQCAIDSVIGDASGYELSAQFLSAMHHLWFKS